MYLHMDLKIKNDTNFHQKGFHLLENQILIFSKVYENEGENQKNAYSQSFSSCPEPYKP